jgi:hypothetical protein
VLHHPLCNAYASVPAGCPPAVWRLNLIDVHASAHQHPGDHGVRVPHVADDGLSSPPDEGRHRFNEIEDSAGLSRVLTQPLWARDSVQDVWNHSVPPPSDFIPEQTEPGQCAVADRTLHDDATGRTFPVGNGPCHLDYRSPLRDTDLERRVVQIGGSAMFAVCADAFIDPAVEANEVTPRAKGEPVKIDASLQGRGRPRFRGTGPPRYAPIAHGIFPELIRCSALALIPFSILRSIAKSPNSIRIKLNVASRGVCHR